MSPKEEIEAQGIVEYLKKISKKKINAQPQYVGAGMPDTNKSKNSWQKLKTKTFDHIRQSA